MHLCIINNYYLIINNNYIEYRTLPANSSLFDEFLCKLGFFDTSRPV
jgi:hypothetical protein